MVQRVMLCELAPRGNEVLVFEFVAAALIDWVCSGRHNIDMRVPHFLS